MQTEELRMQKIGKLAAELFHEIKSPLSVIVARTQIMKLRESKKASPDSEILNGLSQIYDQSIRMNKMVERVHNMARGNEIDPKVPELLHTIINDAIAQCSNMLTRDNVPIEVDGTDEFVILSREFQLSQVFTNLIRNSIEAIKHSNHRWIKILYSRSDTQKDWITIRVLDSGDGIKSFETTKDPNGSMGIGLELSKEIIKEHGGELVYMENQGNTEFRIHLPLAKNLEKNPP